MSIKVRNENKEFEEVYSKSEMDNVQQETITINSSNEGAGTLEINFRKKGNMVFVKFFVTLNAGFVSASFISDFTPPAYAKPIIDNGTLIKSFVPYTIVKEPSINNKFVLESYINTTLMAINSNTLSLIGEVKKHTSVDTSLFFDTAGCYIANTY